MTAACAASVGLQITKEATARQQTPKDACILDHGDASSIVRYLGSDHMRRHQEFANLLDEVFETSREMQSS